MNLSTQTIIKKHRYFNQNFFAKWAKLYDYEKYFFFPLRNKAANLLNLPKKSKIIDVATGTGAQAYALAKNGYEVVGIDLSHEMLEQAKKKIRKELTLSFLHTDATNIPFDANTFDGASISLGLHDMPYEIRLIVLREIIRVTKPGGKIMIIDYFEPYANSIAKVAFQIERLYETPMFEDFVRRSLAHHLNKVGLKPELKSTFLNVTQIVICTNNKY